VLDLGSMTNGVVGIEWDRKFDENMKSTEKVVRPALIEMKQPRAAPSQFGVVDEDDELPIVDPATLLKKGDQCPALTSHQVCLLSATTIVNNRWQDLLRSLADREGTILDVTADMLAYEDQTMLKKVRSGGVLDVRVPHLYQSLHGNAPWPTVLAVESWLRDGVMAAGDEESRLSHVKMWCLVVGSAVGEEAVRSVALSLEGWYAFDKHDAACSGRSNEMIAKVSYIRSRLCHEYMWTQVMLSLEKASGEVFWDWRRTEKHCFVHTKLQCEKKGWGTADLVLPRPADESDFFEFIRGWDELVQTRDGCIDGDEWEELENKENMDVVESVELPKRSKMANFC